MMPQDGAFDQDSVEMILACCHNNKRKPIYMHLARRCVKKDSLQALSAAICSVQNPN